MTSPQGSRRESKPKRAPGRTSPPKVMTYDEMIAADPVEATEPRPDWPEPCAHPALILESDQKPRLTARAERLPHSGERSLWSVCVESPAGPLLGGLPGRTSERLRPKSLARRVADRPEPDAFRPPWLRSEFFPRIAPRPLDGPAALLAPCTGRLGLRPLISEQLSREWPWCTVGKVYFSRDGHNFDRGGKKAGTGVLVGRNLMLTVSHGAPWGRGPGDWWIEFVPGLSTASTPSEPFGSSYVESFHGVVNEDDVTGLDYVICKLYTPLGDRCGWMGSQWWSSEDPYYDGTWTSVGYPGSFMEGVRPAVEFGIGVRDIDDDGDGLEIETVQFADKGWSGGPLWGWIDGEPRVIGIESGYEKDFLDPTRTVFAGGQHLVDLVKFGIANWS